MIENRSLCGMGSLLIHAIFHSISVSFSRHKDAYPKSRSIHLVRYQVNPTPNWGPKARARKRKSNEMKEDE